MKEENTVEDEGGRRCHVCHGTEGTCVCVCGVHARVYASARGPGLEQSLHLFHLSALRATVE